MPKYFCLDFHYSNPMLDGDVNVSSGYQLIVSRKLRSMDMGSWFAGPSMARAEIEPMQRNVVFGIDFYFASVILLDFCLFLRRAGCV